MRRFLLLSALILGSSFPCAQAFAGNSKQYNFRFSPVGLIVGSISATFDVALTNEWTVGPTAQYWHFNTSQSAGFSTNFDITTYGFGVRGNWFDGGIYNDGWYIGPSLKYASVNVTAKDNTGAGVSGSASGVLLGCLFGYGWFWDSFNMMLGLGADVGLGTSEVTVTNSSGTSTKTSTSLTGLDAEFSIGWTF